MSDAEFANSVFAGKTMFNPHAVPEAPGMGKASWGLLAGQFGWVILAQAISVLGCGARRMPRTPRRLTAPRLFPANPHL